jgi:hypothetical protein
MMLKTVALALAMGSADASYAKIAGYEPGSSVTEHAKIDISAKSMIKSITGKRFDKDDGEDIPLSSDIKTAKTHYQAALDSYTNGAVSSSRAVYSGLTVDKAMGESAGAYTCTGTFGGTDKLLGSPKSATEVGATSLDVYIGSAYDNECGKAPFDETATYTATYSESTCPGAAIANADTIVCVGDGGETVTFTGGAGASATFKGRSLRGFSTGGAEKMDGSKGSTCKDSTGDEQTDSNSNAYLSKAACEGDNLIWTAPVPQEEEYVQAWQFHGMSKTYADDIVQVAMAALLGGAQAFSTCDNDSGATAATCTGTFVQGTVVCKAISDRALSIPTGNTHADQVTACTTGGGKVTDFSTKTDKFNLEAAKKGAVYINAWMYVLHEYEDAIQDCLNGQISNNDASVHAWDEGVAFYVGSLAASSTWVGSTQTGSNGNMIYELANKRCANFGTCTEGKTGNSNVNVALSTQWANGQWACKTGDCAGAVVALDKIKSLMRIPLIQGTLRYAYKMGVEGSGATGDSIGKAAGEGYAFMLSVVHAVAKCDINNAITIYTALDAHDVQEGGSLGGDITFAAVKAAFENNYDCMGITCDDVGGLVSDVSAHGGYYPGAEPCDDHDHDDDEDEDTEEKVPLWAWIALGGAGALVLLFFGLMCSARAARDATKNLYHDYEMQKKGEK